MMCMIRKASIGGRVVTDSIPARACRLRRSEFSVFFSETRVNTGLGTLRKTLTEGTSPTGPGPTSGQLVLTLQPINQPTKMGDLDFRGLICFVNKLSYINRNKPLLFNYLRTYSTKFKN